MCLNHHFKAIGEGGEGEGSGGEGGEGGGSGWAWERKFTIKTEDLSFYPTYVAFSN